MLVRMTFSYCVSISESNDKHNTISRRWKFYSTVADNNDLLAGLNDDILPRASVIRIPLRQGDENHRLCHAS